MPSSGAVIHMLTHRPEAPKGEGPDEATQRRKQMLEAFVRSVWPFNRGSEVASLAHKDTAGERDDASSSS